MSISKRKLINALFIAGFPFYGVGSYLLATQPFSVGIIFSILPFLVILLVYAIDLVYTRTFTPMVNGSYRLAMAYILLLVASLWISLLKGSPGLNVVNVTSMSIMFLVPFNAAVVLQVYNRDNDRFNWTKIVLLGLGALIVLNLAGFAAGYRNMIHGFEGRLSLPFLHGIYDASHVLAMICLALPFFMKDLKHRPFRFVLMIGSFVLGIAIMLNLNSRLSTMIFIVLIVLFFTRSIKAAKGLFTISLFTMPILVSFSHLVYSIISIPVIANLLGRVSKEDVTTFNGRTYIWEAVGDWFLHDRTGLFFGSGYMGQYRLGILDFMKRIWKGEVYNIHLHSTFLEVVVDQGLLGLILLYMLTYRAFVYYRSQYLRRTILAPLFAAVVYLMFIWQIDIFCYGIYIGNAIMLSLFSIFCIDPKWISRKELGIDGELLLTEK